MRTPQRSRTRQQRDEIVEQLVRRHSTAAVLFHHATAERLGLGPTDHKCLDLLRERGPMTGSQLAAITGLTTGAITGVVGRLERAGYLHRAADSHDGRKQILVAAVERMQDLHDVFAPIRQDLAALLERFDERQLAAIAEFLLHTTDFAYRHVALLRAGHRAGGESRAPKRSPATASKRKRAK
jgi:DNA-binding MarR family transcriptional regulator